MKLPPLAAAVAAALRSAGTPVRGEKLVVALSGGPDSVALLDALSLLARPLGLRLVAAHLDHGLRAGSADDAAFCVSLCQSLGVPIRAGSADVRARAAREGGGIEQAARRERYAFLRRVCREETAAAIAVAHTRDDQAETLLLRLLRGAGAPGLAGMRLRRGRLVRPLLGVSREEVLAHLRARGLAFREDPTNAELVHRRNRVRHELLPYLASHFNPRVREALARTAGLLADEAAYLRGEAERLLDRAVREQEGVLVLRRAALAQAPPPLARVAIRRALAGAGGLRQLGAVHVERVLRLVRSAAPAGRSLPLPGGRLVRFTREDVRFERSAPSSPNAVSSAAKR
jgi:tRNA(Ile)-lysidine synthase